MHKYGQLIEALSGIIDVAYFELLDDMLRLGTNIEGFGNLVIKMDEERYRDDLVNYLDSLSEDHHATAETFRGSGKRDILLRNTRKRIFWLPALVWQGIPKEST